MTVVVGVLVGCSLGTASAGASCGPTGHCYTLAISGPVVPPESGYKGASLNVRSNCLSVADPANNFVTNEMWVAFEDGGWTEAGIAAGNPAVSGRYFFWAQQWGTDNLTYTEFDFPNGEPFLNTYYPVSIRFNGSTWDVSVGSNLAVSTGQPAVATELNAGTESTDSSTTAYGSSSDLKYVTLDGATRNSWATVQTGDATLSVTPVDFGFANWRYVNSWMRDGTTATC